ncbi:hypothetical protein JANAI62_08540 [Jannaschia pagri]|uniref:AB hydrolase-1 domain-containing protein n=1 Tax=Jannaschia pagri TaxID=2829797 RepID=A0ABQ4NIS3_9RHOB|nr:MULTISPECIES: alpha/beta hydrolase [unclassified Jannaschia]GIT89661.1 hypothetical protein JANAI61_01190 [Jannaschia sp. AI_61]GIT94231.1 hypothetical protein JANAI62_08540 [Jannaschia sp. AI_62]
MTLATDDRPARKVFCHGIPGSPQDVRLLPRADIQSIYAPNLLAHSGSDPLQGFAHDCNVGGDGRTPLHLIGFSLGAMVALRYSARYPQNVARITLISAAAPLPLADVLSRMAGAPVFRLATHAPGLFRALTYAQGALAKHRPRLLLRQLFASAHPSEQALLDDQTASQVLIAALNNSYCANRRGYRTWVGHYVQDWSADLARVTCPVTLWHGEHDTWAPPEMSDALSRAIAGPTQVIRLPQAGHYGTLRAADIP